jgi:1-acyl-sn-glycerol-3-phosphate acyltransferase
MTTAVPPIDARAYRLARTILRLAFRGYFETHLSGQANLPLPGVATVVAANHASALDVFVAGYALGRPGHFLAKMEATRTPLVGRFLLALGAIPARRDERDTEALRRLLAVLESGGLVGVAPEGTRSRDGLLGPYDPGFLWLAARTGARVVPCAIHGTRPLLPPGRRLPRRGPLWVRFGPALTPEELGLAGRPGRAELERAAEVVRSHTAAMLADLAAESGLPAPALRPDPGPA